MEFVQLKDKKFGLSSSPGWLPPRVYLMDTIEENKKDMKVKQGLQSVPTGNSPTGI